ncbi:hypothetical protein ACLOJK_025289 [Asimina triloba]
MGNHSKCYLCFLLLSFLFCNIAPLPTDASSQTHALTKLWKAKRAARLPTAAADFETKIFRANDVIVPQLPGSSKESDKIVKLPGQPHDNVDFAHYGGYITVDEEAGRALFYYFAEATRYQHAARPLILWLNGGPGCSSLIGAMEELGPFRVKSDGKTLYRNEFSWNTGGTSDYNLSGDKKTAEDAYVFLVNWLEKFPEYKTRDFYITGESYAGHYVPQLAHTILRHNQLPNSSYINLKGIMFLLAAVKQLYGRIKVCEAFNLYACQTHQDPSTPIGNAAIHDLADSLGMYDYFWTHALISDETILKVHEYCNFSAENLTDQCNDALFEADQPFSDLNIYNIYAPLCHSTNLTLQPKKASIVEYDPCSNYYFDAYLNTPEVQEALHANLTKLNYTWSMCSDVIPGWRDSQSTVLPLLQEFMAKGLRVWVYSGDIDGRLPITSTRYSLNKLKLPVKSAWRPWFVNGEVGGYIEVYEGDITLATVRGAGHEVPSYQPTRALNLIHYFLLGKPL